MVATHPRQHIRSDEHASPTTTPQGPPAQLPRPVYQPAARSFYSTNKSAIVTTSPAPLTPPSHRRLSSGLHVEEQLLPPRLLKRRARYCWRTTPLTRTHKLLLGLLVLMAICAITAGAAYATWKSDRGSGNFTCGTDPARPTCAAGFGGVGTVEREKYLFDGDEWWAVQGWMEGHCQFDVNRKGNAGKGEWVCGPKVGGEGFEGLPGGNWVERCDGKKERSGKGQGECVRFGDEM